MFHMNRAMSYLGDFDLILGDFSPYLKYCLESERKSNQNIKYHLQSVHFLAQVKEAVF